MTIAVIAYGRVSWLLHQARMCSEEVQQEEKILYFAYDRLISKDLMQEEAKGPQVEQVGTARLVGWSFVCNRKGGGGGEGGPVVLHPNAVKAEEDSSNTQAFVEGVVFRLHKEQLKQLDAIYNAGCALYSRFACRNGANDDDDDDDDDDECDGGAAFVSVGGSQHSKVTVTPLAVHGDGTGAPLAPLVVMMHHATPQGEGVLDTGELGQAVYGAIQAKLSSDYIASLEAMAKSSTSSSSSEESQGKEGGEGGAVVVFVYGTLMSGLRNHHLLDVEGAKPLGPGTTVDKMVMMEKGVPFVSRRREESSIVGELYEVDGPTLQALDRLEGHPTWYQRVRVQVEQQQGGGGGVVRRRAALMYVCDEGMGEGLVIRDGDYRRHTLMKQQQERRGAAGRRGA